MSLGLNESDFWESTPYMFHIYIEAENEKRKMQANENITLAWHTAYFNNVAKTGKLKPLSKYLIGAVEKKLTSEDKILAAEAFKSALPKMTVEEHIAKINAKKNPQ